MVYAAGISPADSCSTTRSPLAVFSLSMPCLFLSLCLSTLQYITIKHNTCYNYIRCHLLSAMQNLIHTSRTYEPNDLRLSNKNFQLNRSSFLPFNHSAKNNSIHCLFMFTVSIQPRRSHIQARNGD